jgi:HD domain
MSDLSFPALDGHPPPNGARPAETGWVRGRAGCIAAGPALSCLWGLHFPAPVARIVHEHHEWLDGSGYPHGLAGDAICTEPRAVAVAELHGRPPW